MSHKTLCGATQGKFWGKTSCFYVSDSSEVLEGELKVILYKDDGEDETILTAGMFSDVPPMVDHRFVALKDTKALEIYWTDALDPTDIVREDTGGML
jgi:hypothetical protein